MMTARPALVKHLEVGPLVAIVVFVLGVLWMTVRLIYAAPVPVTDLDRDLIGARAAIEGHSPYQRLGEIELLIPDVDIPEAAESFWVSHTPFSIAMARLLLVTTGDNAEAVARIVAVTAILLLMVYPAVPIRLSWPVRLLLAGALAMSFGTDLDVTFLQGAALLAVGLALSLGLLAKGRRWLGLILLAVCVAWRPWCAPLALFLPSSRRPLRDAAWVASGAVAITLASMPAIGGPSPLLDWVLEVSPVNLRENFMVEWNGALLVPLAGVAVSLALLVLTTLALVAFRKGATAESMTPVSLAILSLFPLVWPPHWVGLYPALLSGRSEQGAAVLGLAFLLQANPLVTESSLIWRVVSWSAIVGLAAWHVMIRGNRPDRPD